MKEILVITHTDLKPVNKRFLTSATSNQTWRHTVLMNKSKLSYQMHMRRRYSLNKVQFVLKPNEWFQKTSNFFYLPYKSSKWQHVIYCFIEEIHHFVARKGQNINNIIFGWMIPQKRTDLRFQILKSSKNVINQKHFIEELQSIMLNQ